MQIQLRDVALDHADRTAPARQIELPGTSYKTRKRSGLKYLNHEVGIDDLSAYTYVRRV